MIVKIKYKAVIVNAPDYQSRIYKRIPNRIKWDRRLHETIIGHDQYAKLPDEKDLSLYHDKTIEMQIETNLRYNRLFTHEENLGHHVFESKPRPTERGWLTVKEGIVPKIGDIVEMLLKEKNVVKKAKILSIPQKHSETEYYIEEALSIESKEIK